MATKAENGCGGFLRAKNLGEIPDEVRAYLHNPQTTAEALIRDKMLPLAVKSPVGPPESIYFRYKIGRIFDEWVGGGDTARRFDLINALATYPNILEGMPKRRRKTQDMEFAIGQLLENCGFPEELMKFLGRCEVNMTERPEKETRQIFDRVASAIWSKVIVGEECSLPADPQQQEEAKDITLVACSYPPDDLRISTPAKENLAEALLRQTPQGREDEIGENVLWYGLGGGNEGERAGRALLGQLNIEGNVSMAEWLVAKITETPLSHDEQGIWSNLARTVILGYKSRHLLCAALVEKISGITDADNLSEIASVCRGLDAIVCAPEGAITEETAETLIGIVLGRLSQSLAVGRGEFVHHIPMLRLAGALAERCSETSRNEMQAKVMAIVSNLHPTGRQAANKLEKAFGIQRELGEVSGQSFTRRLFKLWGYEDDLRQPQLSEEQIDRFADQLLAISHLTEEHKPRMMVLLRGFEAQGETLHPQALEGLTEEERDQFGRRIAAHFYGGTKVIYTIDPHQLTADQMELLQTAKAKDAPEILQTMAIVGEKSGVWDGITRND